MGLSTFHIDYLQRSFEPPSLAPGQVATSAPPILRRLWHVRGVGKMMRGMQPYPAAGEPVNVMRDALIGVFGYKLPVGFLVQGDSSGVTLKIGIWSPAERENPSQETLDARAHILGSVLASLYPDIEILPSDSNLPAYPLAGIGLGQPSSKPPEAMDGALPLDRMIRALYGSEWAALVLADPIEESVLSDIRNNVLNEVRAVQAEALSMGAPSPLSDLYQQLLQFYLLSYTQGQAEGAWRTGVYLLGGPASYYRLASIWRSTFSGDESVTEPVRVYEHSHVRSLAHDWALPDVDGLPGPGNFQHPFSYQSLLTSTQLANYIQLPGHETSGFSIRLVPDFDAMPPDSNDPASLVLGQVLDRNHQTSAEYRLSRSVVNRHALIAGVTGVGKTNTVFHLLTQLWDQQIPFLVLEPAKTEYRALLDHPFIGPDLRVFTPGDENVSPLRLNPFEVEAGISVATHIDLLKSVFNASFGMWNPLPQILERCIHAVYADCGWDPARGGNTRLESDGSPPTVTDRHAFPTLTQLLRKVEEVVDGLGYDSRVTSDIKAALMTRLNSLRIGAKGMMLDTHRSMPLAELLRQPTVIEMEAIGDDDEKAFVMGLLMVRLYEHLRCRGALEGVTLQHVTVIEEAHRLLANVPAGNNPELANTRGKAVETFANMLSEVRAYGESFLVAEQIPSKLAPDVIKNTNLKVVHRVVSEDDRRALGGTMNMAEDQMEMLATLRTGQAAVFSEGDDRPLLVQVPYAKLAAGAGTATKHESDNRVADHMSAFQALDSVTQLLVPHARCAELCGQPYRHCDDVKPLVEQKRFQRQFSAVVLSALLDEAALPGRLSDLLTTIRAHLPKRALEETAYYCVTLNAVEWYVTRFGRLYHWNYGVSAGIQAALTELFTDGLARVLGGDSGGSTDAATFGHAYREACKRRQDPFPACSQVCPDNECLFRYHASMLMDDDALAETFNLSMAEAGTEESWSNLSAIYDVITRFKGTGFEPRYQRSLGLCYGVQRIAFMPGLFEAARGMATDDLIEGYDAVN